MAEAIRTLQNAGVPVFGFPDAAANAFCHLWRNRLNIAAMFETPLPIHEPSDRKQIADRVDELIATVRREGNCLLDEAQSKQLLALYGLPVVETAVAHGPGRDSTSRQVQIPRGAQVAVADHYA